MALRPRELPKARHQLVKSLRYPDADTALMGEDERGMLLSHLEGAGLYWVAPDMAALAVHSGGRLEAARWANSDRPSPRGLIAFDGGIGSVPTPPTAPGDLHGAAGKVASRIMDATDWGTALPVDALTWGGHRGDCRVGLWIRKERILEAMRAAGLPNGGTPMPPMMCLSGWPLPVTAEPVPFAELEQPDGTTLPETVLRTLAAAWLLMRQPKIADRTIVKADKSSHSTAGRLGYHDPDVTVVDLRRLYAPSIAEETGTEGGRRYRHRWVVGGHWRHYSHPRFSEERRAFPEWIAEYTKGPDGAPLLLTEKVNVWRR